MRFNGRVRLTRSLLLLALIAAVAPARAENASDALLRTLQPQGFVSDYAGVFSAEQKTALEARLKDVEAHGGVEIAVVAIRSMGGGEIDDFTNRLFERWKIGKKGKDNGVLILASIQDRKMRIEVGYGLESVLNDARAGAIRDEFMLPEFREGRYANGLMRGAEGVIAVVAPDLATVPPPANPPSTAHPQETEPMAWVILGLTLAIIFLSILSRRKRSFLWIPNGSGGWTQSGGGGFSSGGFSSGGFGGFGGGSSGGGGASGSW